MKISLRSPAKDQTHAKEELSPKSTVLAVRLPGKGELVNLLEESIGNGKKTSRNTMHADGF